MRPHHVEHVIGEPLAEVVMPALRRVARHVMRTGQRILLPGVGVAYRKTRSGGVVGGRQFGRTYSLALAASKRAKRKANQ